MKLYSHTDGGARGNPGPAAVGVVIERCACTDPKHCTESKREQITGFGKTIGETTNNTAEYTAVIEALSFLLKIRTSVSFDSVAFFLDSTLVVNQLNGIYKIKESRLRDLVLQVHMLETELGIPISYTSVPREENRAADFYVNQVPDAA